MAEFEPMLPTALCSCCCAFAAWALALSMSFFGAGLRDLSLEGHKTLLESFDLGVLPLHLGRQRCGGLLEGLAPGKGLTGQVLFTLLEGQLGTLVPGLGLGLSLLGLAAEPFLAGNRHRHRLAQLHQIRLHVGDRLVENLDGVFHAADCSIGVRAHQSAQAIKETHGGRPMREIDARRVASPIR